MYKWFFSFVLFIGLISCTNKPANYNDTLVKQHKAISLKLETFYNKFPIDSTIVFDSLVVNIENTKKYIDSVMLEFNNKEVPKGAENLKAAFASLITQQLTALSELKIVKDPLIGGEEKYIANESLGRSNDIAILLSNDLIKNQEEYAKLNNLNIKPQTK